MANNTYFYRKEIEKSRYFGENVHPNRIWKTLVALIPDAEFPCIALIALCQRQPALSRGGISRVMIFRR